MVTGAPDKPLAVFLTALMVFSSVALAVPVDAAPSPTQTEPMPQTHGVETTAVSTSSCQEINQSGLFELSGDVRADTGSDCFLINASDVVFEGNGYEIFNESDFTSVAGISTTRSVSNVTIRNVTVRGMDNNIEVGGVPDVSIHNVTTVDAWDDGIQVDHSENVTITAVNASGNRVYGISAIDVTNITIRDSVVTGSFQSNIRFDEVSDGLITTTNSSAAGIGGSGVYLNASGGIEVRNSQFLGNDEAGVNFQNTDNSMVVNVTTEGNNDGILVASENDASSTGNKLLDNTIRRPRDTGIDIVDSPHNTVRNNSIVGEDAGSGIEVRSSFKTAYNVTVANNTVEEVGTAILVNGNHRARFDDEPLTVYRVKLHNNTVRDGDSESIGVWLLAASNVTMRNNAITGYEHNFVVEEYSVEDPGYSIRQFHHDIDTSNTLDGDPIYYLVNESDRTIGPAESPGFVGVFGGSNITVRDTYFHNSSPAVLFAGTENATVRNVTAEHVEFGVKAASTTGTTVENSTFRNLNENEWAVWLANSSTNTISGNEFVQEMVGNNGLKAWNDSDGNLVEDNTIEYVGERNGNENGILIGSGSDDNRIRSNVLNGTEIQVGGGYPDAESNNVTQNTVKNVLDNPGIDAGSRANGTYISGNDLVNTSVDAFTGAALLTGTNGTVRANLVNGSQGSGIEVFKNSTVADNTVRRVERHGIQVPSDLATIRNNTIETAEIGINIEGSNTTIIENTIRNTTRSSFAYGIYDDEHAEGTEIRNNTINRTVIGLWLGGEGLYGNVSDNSIVDSRVGIRIRNDEARNYTVNDTRLRNSSQKLFRDEPLYDSTEATDTGIQVANLSTSDLSLTFTHKAVAIGRTVQPSCDPTSKANLGVFLNVTNTSASAWWDFTLDYTDVDLGGADESSVSLYRYDGSSWTAVSATQDEAANTLSANVSSFGIYGLFANGTATCANGLLALSETTTLPSDQVSTGLETALRIDSTLAANASATLLTSTSGEFSFDVNVTSGAQNVTFWLNATTLEAAVGNLSNVNLTVDGVKQPYNVETFAGQPWVGFEIDHFSNRTVAFKNASAAAEPTTIKSFEATVSDENVTTRINATGTLSAVTVDVTNGSGTVESLSLADFTESEIGSTGNYTYLNTTRLAPGTYNVTLSSAKDADGNEIASGQTREVTIAAPASVTLSNVTAIDAGDGDGNVTTGDTVEVRADAGGSVGSVTANASAFGGSSSLTLSDGNTDGTYNATFSVDAATGAGDGDHTIQVTASNAENSTSASTNALTLDASAPTFWFNSVTDTDDSNGEVGDGDSVKVNTTAYDLESDIDYVAVDASDFGAGTVFLSDPDDDNYYTGNFTVDASSASADGDYKLSGTAVNNVDLSTSATSTMLTLNTSSGSSDTTEPVVSNATMEDVPVKDYFVNDGDTIHIAVDVADTGGSGIANVTADASGFGAGTVVLSDGDGDGRYNATFTVNAAKAPGDASVIPSITSTDGAGNTNSTSPTVPVTLDTTAPTASVTANRTTVEPGQVIAFNASGSSDPTPGLLSKHAWDFESDGVVNTSGFFPGGVVTHAFSSTGTYTVTVNVTDDADNFDTSTLSVTVESNDTTGPMITNASVEDLPDNDSIVADADTVYAAVTVSDDGSGVSSVSINFSALGAFGPVSLTDGDDDGVYDTNFTVDGGNAPEDGSFDFEVTATDNASNIATARTNTLTVDTLGPSTTDVVALNLNGTNDDVNDGDTIQVTANVSDSTTGVGSVVVNASALGDGSAVSMTDGNKDGQYEATVTVNGSADSIASNGSTVAVTVLATDGAGNEGFEKDTNELTLNYMDSPDGTPPTISNPIINDSDGDKDVSDSERVEISVTVTDEQSEVGTVIADASAFGGSTIILTDSDEDGIYTGNFTADVDAAPSTGNQAVTIEANDTAGNSAIPVESNELNLLAPTTVDGGQPGFGLGVAVIGLILAGLFAVRRRQ